MDRFLTRSQKQRRAQSLPRVGPAGANHANQKMAAATHAGAGDDKGDEVTGILLTGTLTPAPAQKVDCTHIAEEVAQLIHPIIVKAVEAALSKSLQAITQDIATQSQRIQAIEQRVSDLEDELTHTTILLQEAEDRNISLYEKVEDLENRSRRNNLRIVGLPENYMPQTLMDICQKAIPKALGLPHMCTAERAHRLGPPQQDRQTPRPVIVRYLNYADRQLILQQFRNRAELQIEGNTLLLFVDYSADVSRRRRAFSTICTKLHRDKIRFMLLYPATLKITEPGRQQHLFSDPIEAASYLENMQEVHDAPQHPNEIHTADASPRTKGLGTPQRRQPRFPQKQYTPSPRKGRFRTRRY